MPFKAPESPKCPLCDRSVYAAEEKVAGGYKWHKVCFKCSMCNKMLDSTSCAEHERALYCKTCYGRKYGPKGVGFGSGAGALSMDTGAKYGNEEHPTNGHHRHQQNTAVATADNVIKAPEGQGCPRCGGFVYHADQVFSKGQCWHKGCFKCAVCHRVLDSRIACDGPDRDVYCNGCYRKNFGLKGYGFGQGGPALISGNIGESQSHVPATAKSIDTTSIPAAPGEGCPRCGGQVFHAEQMFSKGRTYHKKCFACGQCKRPLDSVLHCDAPDGDIYCKGCYGKTFGAKGYGFGCGAGFLQCGDLDGKNAVGSLHLSSDTGAIPGADGAKDTCPRCGGQVFHAEKMLSKHNVFHKTCFSCHDCKRPLDSTLCCDSPDGEIYCKLCYGKNFGPKGYGYGGGSMPALLASGLPGQQADGRIQVDFLPPSNGEKSSDGKDCPRCGCEVFEAEKLIAARRCWHRRCFSCISCQRHLDSFSVNDGPDGDIYCKSCYGAAFGVRGYGFGGGAGTLNTEGNSPRIAAETAFILP